MGVDRKMIVFFFPFLSSLVVLLSREAHICVDYDDDVGIHFFAINCPPSPRHLSRAYLSRCSRVMRRIPNVPGSCSRRVGIGCLLCVGEAEGPDMAGKLGVLLVILGTRLKRLEQNASFGQ